MYEQVGGNIDVCRNCLQAFQHAHNLNFKRILKCAVTYRG